MLLLKYASEFEHGVPDDLLLVLVSLNRPTIGKMPDDKNGLTFEQFKEKWKSDGESEMEIVVDTAWRRYQQVNAKDYQLIPEGTYPSLDQLRARFDALLNQPSIEPLWTKRAYLTLPANVIPWTPTGVFLSDDQAVSVFATGRTWRSKLLDLYLPPHFNLWYRIGVNGSIFNSTHDTRTFKCIESQGGELFLAHQYPGAFHDREGGRVGGNLSVYDKAEGTFQIGIVQWQQSTTLEGIKVAFKQMLDLSGDVAEQEMLTSTDPYGLLSTAIERLSSDYFAHSFPVGWRFLWFLGMGEIFFQEQADSSGQSQASKPASNNLLALPTYGPEDAMQVAGLSSQLVAPFETLSSIIRCSPNHNVGILQKNLSSPIPLSTDTTTTWSWNITALPSRLREDTTISHDYLSLAFEFENGRDLTYTWSWELPVGFGYWCPLAAWCDREYHIVIRSGTEQLGQWLNEERNIYEDYRSYVNGGDVNKAVPQQIVRVWLIAGNRWQRHRGEMLVKDIRMHVADGEKVKTTVVL